MSQLAGVPDRFRSMRVGSLLACLSIAHGFGLGGVFGAFEKNIKNHLKAEAKAVVDSAYGGDAAAMKKVTDKSWVYCRRAHLHGTAVGTSALALSLMMLFFVGTSQKTCGFVSGALGAGALGYSLFWLLAALRAPGLGGTGAAKETLQWLAFPSAGLAIAGLLAVLVLLVRETFIRRPAAD